MNHLAKVSTGSREDQVHARLDLPACRFSGFALTDGHGAERLDRFTPEPGAIVLADRGYARHGGMGAVWTQGPNLVARYTGACLQAPTTPYAAWPT